MGRIAIIYLPFNLELGAGLSTMQIFVHLMFMLTLGDSIGSLFSNLTSESDFA